MPGSSVALLTGAAPFVADRPDPRLAGAARAVFVRSTVAHANFEVDVSAARSVPGVVAVVTADDHAILPTGAYRPNLPDRFAQPLLAEARVRFVGEPIAVVIGETLAAAVDAAELVVVDYDELPVVVSVDRAGEPDAELLFPDGALPRISRDRAVDDGPSNVVVAGAPAPPGAAADDAVTVRVAEWNPRQAAAPIECRAAAAAWDLDGSLTTWVATQTPHSFRDRIAPMYRMDPAKIRVIAGPFVGGGFGGKGAPGPEEQLIPELARIAGRPVQWIETRGENLSGAPQGRGEQLEVELSGTADGQFTALRVDLIKDAGAYPSSGAALPGMWSGPVASGVYDIAAVSFGTRTVVTNRPPVSALRGAGRGPVIAALEAAVDRFARAIGMDPAEVRRRNLIRPEVMPYDNRTGGRYDEADHPQALDLLLDALGYDDLRAEQAQRRSSGDTRLLGIGIGLYVHRTNGGSSEIARVTVEAGDEEADDISVTVVTGTTDQGQDHAGTWAAIAARELGVDEERVVVVEGDTAAIDRGIGAIGSRSVQTAGIAVHRSAADVVDLARAAAADLLEAAVDDVVIDRSVGQFHVAGTPARSVTWGQVAAQASLDRRELSCDTIHDPEGLDVYPSGAHGAVVEVDADTGRTTVVRFIAVDDAGVRVNHSAVEGQIHGGAALGIAQVLGEACTYGPDGQPRAGSFVDYPALTIDQVPQYELVEHETPTTVNPFGWKAVGESGPIGAVPAVRNAIVDALAHVGVEHLDLPCTPQRVWRALNGVDG